MKIEKSLLSGSTPMLILALLSDGDKYGYEMIEQLAQRSDNTFQLKEGTLYPLLHVLEQEGLVQCYTKAAPNGRTRKYYRLTDAGRGRLEEKTAQWREFSAGVNAVLNMA